jgi:AraC family transcriptional regulator
VLAAAEVPGIDPARVELLPAHQARDARIEQVALALLGELHADAPGGRLYAEALATMLAVHLLRHHSSLGYGVAQRVAQLPSGLLSEPALRAVLEYVEAYLDRSLALSELAAVVGLSQRHFVRLFRATTGQSAHRYLIARRVERAKALLTTTDLPIAQIAAIVGFADRSHLAAHFRRLVGTTPAELRRRSGRILPADGWNLHR